MNLLRYYRDVLKAALRHSLDATQTILFIAFVAVGAASHFVPQLAPTVGQLSGWEAAAVVLAAIFVIRLLLAPYWMHTEQRRRLTIAEAKVNDCEPRPEWIRICNGPFIAPFAPEYARLPEAHTPMAIQEFMIQAHLTGKARHPEMRKNVAVPEARNQAGHDLVFAAIHWEERSFEWKWERPATETKPRGEFGLNIYPAEIGASQLQLRQSIGDGAYNYISRGARFAWALMVEAMNTLIANGDLLVMARPGSPTARFERVPADSWKHYTVRNWETGYAEGKGARLYSVHLCRADG